jgi:hypothetical protein
MRINPIAPPPMYMVLLRSGDEDLTLPTPSATETKACARKRPQRRVGVAGASGVDHGW